MRYILDQMLSKYQINTLYDKKNAIKEIIQEIVLCGLSRGGFFKKAAFYGGTALRIFFGLDRFSEDLDFSLMAPDSDFELSKYFRSVEDELRALGLDFSVTSKEKTGDSAIRSAFLKGNTREHILTFYGEDDDVNFIPKGEVIKIKLEVDTNPPDGAVFETKFGLLPAPYQLTLYDLPSLFAGKIHACLCRKWQNRVKGRDFYDYLFFLSMGTRVNLKNLKARMIQTNSLCESDDLNEDTVRALLFSRFEEVDFRQAREDVFPFVRDKSKLDIWSKDFFVDVTKNLKCVD